MLFRQWEECSAGTPTVYVPPSGTAQTGGPSAETKGGS